MLLGALGAVMLVPAFAGALPDQPSQVPDDAPRHEVALTEQAEPGFQEVVETDAQTELVGVKWNGPVETEFTVEVQEEDGTWTTPFPVDAQDIGPDAGTPEATEVAARRESDFISEPVTVADPESVRVSVAGGSPADVELVTIGGEAPVATDEAGPATTTPPETAPPSTGPPSESPAPPTSTEPAQASVLTWTGGLLLGSAVTGGVLVARRRHPGMGRRALFGVLVIVLALAASGCVGGGPGGGQASGPAPWPGIRSRAHWGAQEGPPCAGYMSGVRFAVVHHTGGGPQDNNYSDPAAKIQGIYQYHLASGYCDIAYNFLVDKYGGMWEGRAGGMSYPVLGAHAAPFNTDSTGVAMLGDFTNVNTTLAAADAVIKVISWKFQIHHVDPWTPAPAAGTFVNPVSAHRDVNQTACPGNSFYPSMGAVRNQIGSRVFYGSPVGSYNYAQRVGAGNEARIIGWALDPDTEAPIPIHVYVGTEGYQRAADLARDDVANLYPGYGPNHGFDTTVPVPPGPVDVCVYAINVSHGGPAFLGCATV